MVLASFTGYSLVDDVDIGTFLGFPQGKHDEIYDDQHHNLVDDP